MIKHSKTICVYKTAVMFLAEDGAMKDAETHAEIFAQKHNATVTTGESGIGGVYVFSARNESESLAAAQRMVVWLNSDSRYSAP